MLTKYLLTNHLLHQETRLRERRTPVKPHSRPANPFRIHGTVEGPFFTDRADELARTLASLREPGAKLLVYGPRRMGKSSLLAVALERLARTGQRGFLADLSKSSTLADMAYRVLEAATRTLGTDWKHVLRDLAARLAAVATWAADPATGALVPRFEVALRRAPLEDQRTTLASVLDALEASAKAKGICLGVVLDEFQEIHRFGGEDAEWHLRGVVQHHRHLSYVFAGSAQHLIEQMLGPSRAFYELLDVLPFGPIEPAHLARWIEERMGAAGVRAEGVGAWIVAYAGPRTRDVVRVARTCFDRARADGRATPALASAAMMEEVGNEDDAMQRFWSSLTAHQQNVLRAVAAGAAGITGGAAREEFGLQSSSAVAQTLAAFLEQGRLVRARPPEGYAFDSPFAAAWVLDRTMLDLGIQADPIRPRGAAAEGAGAPHPAAAARPPGKKK